MKLTLKLECSGRELELTQEEARALHDLLAPMFAKPPPFAPTLPLLPVVYGPWRSTSIPQWPNPPFEITCSPGDPITVTMEYPQ